VQLTDGYVSSNGELYLIGCRINALRTASTHVHPEADRTKKLLMHKDEIRRLIGKVEQKGFTLVPLNLHYKGGRVKAEIALAKGKAQHDKRNTEKQRDWDREKGRLMRHKVSSPEGSSRSRPGCSACSAERSACADRPAGRRGLQPDREAHQRARYGRRHRACLARS
jgi:SsrA-binding protein